MIFLVVALAWAYILFVPTKPLPVQTGNGTYTNPCCAPLTLRNGQAHSTDVVFSYVIEPGKEGPRVRLDHRILVVERDHLILGESNGQFLRLDRFTPPRWLDIEGVRFVRTATANVR